MRAPKWEDVWQAVVMAAVMGLMSLASAEAADVVNMTDVAIDQSSAQGSSPVPP